MPPRYRRPTRTLRGGRRRKLVWATTNTSFSLAAGANTTIDLLAGFEIAGASKLGVTVMRTHLRLNWTYGAAADNVVVGLSVVRDSDIGTTRVNPNSDPELDWMLWEAIYADSMGAGATINTIVNLVFDVRSRRKVEELGQTYGLSLTNANAATAGNPRVSARVLLALP